MNFKLVGHDVINFDDVIKIAFGQDPAGNLIADISYANGKFTNHAGKEAEALATWASDESEVAHLTPVEDMTKFPSPAPRGTPRIGGGGIASAIY